MFDARVVVRLPKKAAPQPKKIEVKSATQSSTQPSEAGTEAEASREG